MEWYVIRGDNEKNDEVNELKHYGIKGQQWGKRNYQYEDGSLTPEGKRRYTDNKQNRAKMLTNQPQTWTATRASEIGSDEGRERYRKMQKERQAFKNSDEVERSKQIARMKSSADKKALSKAAKISQDIAHKIRLEEEQNGRSIANMYTEEVDDAVQCVMAGLLLWQYEMFNPDMSAVVRVGDDYVRGSYGEIESRFRALISSGKDISDIELISVDPMAKTVYDVDKNGRITNEWKLGDDEINRNKKRREQTNK